MRPAEAHLTPQELESLLFMAADSNVTTANRDATREAQQHLDGCDVCQKMAKRYAKADSALRSLGPKGRLQNKSSSQLPDGRGPGRDCPPEETWLHLAAGLIDDAAASLYVAHAAQCDWCGKLLRETMEDLAQDVTAEEQAAIGKLESASAGWQRELGKKLAGEGGAAAGVATATPARKKVVEVKERKKLGWWPRAAFATASLAVVVLVGWLVWQRASVPLAKRLLARSYTSQRTIELRIAGADYGPMRVERGSGRRDFPASFDVAEWIIKTQSSSHAEDPEWLQAKARAHLLQGNYKDAINELDDALMLRPHNPELLTDKATALFERAGDMGKSAQIDYAEAAEDLSLALKSDPYDPVALFNRAILYEKLHMPNEAIADLEHYLKIDPSGPWADEALDHLRWLKSVVKAHDDALAKPLIIGPGAFVSLMIDPSAVAQVDERIEDYLDLAVQQWLTEAFPVSSEAGNSQARKALRALANVLAERHGDRWLTDFLDSSSQSPIFARAVAALSQAIAYSTRDPSISYSQSHNAEELFSRAGSRSGVLRAKVEEVHALQRIPSSDECLVKARAVQWELRGTGYSWMTIQLGIDQAACFLTLANFEQGRPFVSQAAGRAVASAFPILRLRVIGIAEEFDDFQGDPAAAWATGEEGLAQYWSWNASPRVRAHQFYDVLTYSAEKLGFSTLAVALAQESVGMLGPKHSVNVEIHARQHLADIALTAGLLDLATTELNAADRLLATPDRTLKTADRQSKESPSTSADRSAHIYAEIKLAEIDMRQGRLRQAGQRLESVEGEADLVPALAYVRSFHQAKAELFSLQGRNGEAESEFLHVIKVVEAHNTELVTDHDREAWNEENSGLYRELVQLELKGRATENGLAVWEWYKSARASGPRFADSLSQFLERKQLRQLVARHNQTLLSYSLLPEGLAIWIADDRGIHSRSIELDSARLARLSSNFLNMCADSDSDLAELRLRAQHLFNILVAPVADQLVPGRTIVIETDELIGDLPFQALLTPKGRYLSQDYTIVFSPGLFYSTHLRPPGLLTSYANALVIGSTAHFLSDDVSLRPDDDVVREAIETAHRFVHPTLLQGTEATREAIENALPRSDAFLFGGHALFSVKDEGLLVFTSVSGDGRAVLWDARRVTPRLFSHCQLVVLAACSTGRTFRTRREVHGEMMRSILAAGVPSVIASRWDVDSKQTRLLMGVFYDSLLSGKSAASALRDAELQFIGNPKTDHPYYWAAFAAFGHQ